MSTFWLLLPAAFLLGGIVAICWSMSGRRSPGRLGRYLSGSVFFLIALFCGFGYLASGELSGREEFVWKTGYAVTGLLFLIATIMQLTDSKRNSHR